MANKLISRSVAKAAYKSAKAAGKDIEKMTKAELAGLYFERARKADEKLVKIEKLAENPTYGQVKEWAYARAEKDIQMRFKDESAKVRFDRQLVRDGKPMTKSQIKALISDVEQFHASQTATKRGIDNVARKRAETINAKYGTNFKWNDLAAFLSDGAFTSLIDNKWSSKSAWYKIADIQKKIDNELKNIKKSASKTVRSERFKEEINKLLKDQHIKIEDLR